ncbi:hypothetical protein A7K73_03670 [Candidatus Methylacidiphilum fumarolicum]|nr:hypothetical protein A7K73_03670 [Candidatus Methylacidiphilum fumarolicum]
MIPSFQGPGLRKHPGVGLVLPITHVCIATAPQLTLVNLICSCRQVSFVERGVVDMFSYTIILLAKDEKKI